MIAQLPASNVNGTLFANLIISDFLCSLTTLPASPPYASPASMMNETPPAYVTGFLVIVATNSGFNICFIPFSICSDPIGISPSVGGAMNFIFLKH